ncbi:hypothetical protein J2W49_004875 [Hydrogenophaga palleronii]|uniref:Uncharacterized protein n=1 Tax=Hydrogenophaga palleronii TaxID=65655 RepID=A0ABU1WVL5_9BURK|nr:hypothetical protein [Hydrogenophaga palleronii]
MIFPTTGIAAWSIEDIYIQPVERLLSLQSSALTFELQVKADWGRQSHD